MGRTLLARPNDPPRVGNALAGEVCEHGEPNGILNHPIDTQKTIHENQRLPSAHRDRHLIPLDSVLMWGGRIGARLVVQGACGSPDPVPPR